MKTVSLITIVIALTILLPLQPCLHLGREGNGPVHFMKYSYGIMRWKHKKNPCESAISNIYYITLITTVMMLENVTILVFKSCCRKYGCHGPAIYNLVYWMYVELGLNRFAEYMIFVFP